jgi:Family of unknown function (DUF5317)
VGNLLLVLLAGAAGVVAGLVRGGRLRGGDGGGVRAWPFGLAALAVQALVGLLPPAGGLGPMLLVAALLTLLAVARANGRLAGVPLLAIGLLANLVVVVANIGMPVPAATLERAGVAVERPASHRPDAVHVLAGPSTRLAALGDRLAVRPLRTVASFGTVAELAGLFLLVQHLLLARREDGADHQARTVPWTTSAD